MRLEAEAEEVSGEERGESQQELQGEVDAEAVDGKHYPRVDLGFVSVSRGDECERGELNGGGKEIVRRWLVNLMFTSDFDDGEGCDGDEGGEREGGVEWARADSEGEEEELEDA